MRERERETEKNRVIHREKNIKEREDKRGKAEKSDWYGLLDIK